MIIFCLSWTWKPTEFGILLLSGTVVEAAFSLTFAWVALVLWLALWHWRMVVSLGSRLWLVYRPLPPVWLGLFLLVLLFGCRLGLLGGLRPSFLESENVFLFLLLSCWPACLFLWLSLEGLFLQGPLRPRPRHLERSPRDREDDEEEDDEELDEEEDTDLCFLLSLGEFGMKL